jgi:hypothetical protein
MTSTTTIINGVRYTSEYVEMIINNQLFHCIVCYKNKEGETNYEIVTPLFKHKPNYNWLRFYHENFIKKNQINYGD